MYAYSAPPYAFPRPMPPPLGARGPAGAVRPFPRPPGGAPFLRPGAPAQQLHKDCGFPWWLVAILVGLLVVLLAWAWWRSRQQQAKVITVTNAGAPGGGGGGNGGAPPAGTGTSPATSFWTTGATSGPAAAAATMGGAAAAAAAMEALRAAGITPPGTVTSPPPSPLPSPMPSPMPSPPPSPAIQANAVRTTVGAEVDAMARAGAPGLVIYTMNGCHVCGPALTEMDKAAACLRLPVLHVERSDISPSGRPKNYPLIFVITPNGEARAFTGPRTSAALVDFVRTNLGPSFVQNCGAQ